MSDNERILTRSIDARVQVRWGETALADSQAVIELDEQGYPPRLYIPMADVATDVLCVSDTLTHCPYKGDATYYHVQIDGDTLEDAAWSYPEPIADVAEIAGHVAFDHDQIEIDRPS